VCRYGRLARNRAKLPVTLPEHPYLSLQAALQKGIVGRLAGQGSARLGKSARLVVAGTAGDSRVQERAGHPDQAGYGRSQQQAVTRDSKQPIHHVAGALLTLHGQVGGSKVFTDPLLVYFIRLAGPDSTQNAQANDPGCTELL